MPSAAWSAWLPVAVGSWVGPVALPRVCVGTVRHKGASRRLLQLPQEGGIPPVSRGRCLMTLRGGAAAVWGLWLAALPFCHVQSSIAKPRWDETRVQLIRHPQGVLRKKEGMFSVQIHSCMKRKKSYIEFRDPHGTQSHTCKPLIGYETCELLGSSTTGMLHQL